MGEFVFRVAQHQRRHLEIQCNFKHRRLHNGSTKLISTQKTRSRHRHSTDATQVHRIGIAATRIAVLLLALQFVLRRGRNRENLYGHCIRVPNLFLRIRHQTKMYSSHSLLFVHAQAARALVCARACTSVGTLMRNANVLGSGKSFRYNLIASRGIFGLTNPLSTGPVADAARVVQ